MAWAGCAWILKRRHACAHRVFLVPQRQKLEVYEIAVLGFEWRLLRGSDSPSRVICRRRRRTSRATDVPSHGSRGIIESVGGRPRRALPSISSIASGMTRIGGCVTRDYRCQRRAAALVVFRRKLIAFLRLPRGGYDIWAFTWPDIIEPSQICLGPVTTIASRHGRTMARVCRVLADRAPRSAALHPTGLDVRTGNKFVN